jgi:hypothetical protein
MLPIDTIRRSPAQRGSIRGLTPATPTASDREQAMTLSGVSALGVLGISQQVKAHTRQTLTASNVYSAYQQSARDIIRKIADS